MMESDSVPLKKRARSFTSTHDDRERVGTASGSISPGGAGSSHPPCALKSVRVLTTMVRISLQVSIFAAGAQAGCRRGRTYATKGIEAEKGHSEDVLGSRQTTESVQPAFPRQGSQLDALLEDRPELVGQEPVSNFNPGRTQSSTHLHVQAAKKARNGPARKRRGTSSSSGVGGGKGSDSSGAHGPSPGALQSAASVLLSFSAMTE